MDIMTRIQLALGLSIVYIIGFYRYYRITAKLEIEKIKTNFKFYPKHYVLPPRWIRKHFKLKKKSIPKFIMFRLYLAVAFIALIPITIIIFLLPIVNATFMYWMPFGLIFFAFVDVVVFEILCSIYNR